MRIYVRIGSAKDWMRYRIFRLVRSVRKPSYFFKLLQKYIALPNNFTRA
jgi:hypothetical protein